jgi:integrase
MARAVGRLSSLAFGRLKDPGMYPDGGGLYLQISRLGGRSWLFRFKAGGRERWMGLGPASLIGLAEARRLAEECRRQRLAGIDPIEARRAGRDKERLEAAKAVTFQACAESYITAHQAGWRNAKHGAQWSATLEAYAYPVFGDLPVQAVDTGMVVKVLEPIWAAKTETASRLRGRIEAVLDWATTRGHRQGENPARWRGHLENLLPAPTKVQKVRHHAALPYSEIGAFMADLQRQEGIAALALRFLILTAARTGEVLGARWDEIDTATRTWTVPAERMKGHREHRVPLSDAALEVLRQVGEVRGGDFVFPGGKAGRPLSNMAMLTLLRRMERADLTAHGFRSTFRDWAAERTDVAREVAEAALAHTIADKVEAAYRRGDLFAKRRQLMHAWARHCSADDNQR